jgi:DNA invertase Pin-like site-specific DNA recombinase
LPERPAAYVRVVGARNARDPHVRDQVHEILAAAGRRGWPRPEVYTEIGLPGWPRPGSVLAQLAGYLASGRHDAIIVATLSRISRDPAEVLAFAVHCGRCGGTLEAVEEGRVDEARIAVLYARHRVVPA